MATNNNMTGGHCLSK